MIASAPAAARLLGIGTALPEHASDQAGAVAFMRRVLQATPPSERRDRALGLLERIRRTGGVQRRHSVVPDFTAPTPDTFELFPPTADLEPFPSTAHRMRLFARKSIPLASCAARAALARAAVLAEQVTHLIICTCTGFFAPGPDVLLAHELGLSPQVERQQLGFMGCYAGLSGLRLASQIVAGRADAVVLQVCIELCTLHYQKDPDPEFVVADLLFGDGVAAAVYAGSRGPGAAALGRIVTSRVATAPDTLDQMAWQIGETGFEMRLSAQVPRSLKRVARGFVDQLLGRAGLRQADVGGWAIHPGGRAILDATADALGLEAAATGSSAEVLADPGNVSSATIFFVLDRMHRTGQLGEAATVALAFGPGLTVEGAILQPD